MIRESAMARTRVKMQERLAATPPATWGKVGAGVLLGGLAVGWLAFPYVLDKVVAYQINLAKGTDSRKLWIQLPTLDFNLYVFNITNPAEVMRGMRPVVEEIGPYCYKEVKDKIDFLEDPATDTISYSARSTWYEDQKSPKCAAPYLTGEEMVVVPNIPLLAVLLIAEKDFPPAFLTLVNQALPVIFGKLDDIFIRVSARKLLFDGIPIDCTATALYPRAVCIALKQNSRALKKLGENKYSFSFFGAKNNTPEEFRYTVKRGTEEGQDIGRLVAFDGKPELPFWRGECNKLQGTDATVFPPFRQKENGSLIAYSSEVCRVFSGLFEGEYDYKGVTGYAYSLSMGDTESNPKDRCFCPSDDNCRKKGVLDSLKCQGAPLIASHPHFYGANMDYLTGVRGLSPDKNKHGIMVVLEPISGTPLVVRKRVQFNIALKPIRYVTVTRRLPRVLMPLFWAEELLDLDADLMGLLEASLFRPIRAVSVLKWMAVAGGISLAGTAVALKVRNDRRDKVHVLKEETDHGWKSGKPRTPQAVLRPTEVIDNITDPFTVNSQDNLQDKDNKEVKLSATSLMKTSTIMLPNEKRSPEVQPVDEPRSGPRSGLSREFPLVEEKSIRSLPSNTDPVESENRFSGSSIVPSNTIPSNILLPEQKDLNLDTNGLINPTYQNWPTDTFNNTLDESPTSEDSPKSRQFPDQQPVSSRRVNPSLELQASIISSVPPFSKLSPYYPPPFTGSSTPTKTKLSKNVMNEKIQSNANSNISVDRKSSAPLNLSKEMLPPRLSDTGRKTMSLDENKLFGEIPIHQTFDLSPSTEKFPESPETKKATNVSFTNLNPGEAGYPSEEELKVVEDDINKLVAEIAQLIPK